MKKVLVAIDYNPCAQKVAETGYKFAKSMNAEMYIVHVISDVVSYALDYTPIMGFKGFRNDTSFGKIEDQQKEANDFLNAVVTYLGDKKINTKVLSGKTAETILKLATDLKADLIVLGAQSHNGREKSLMGNVSSGVLMQTPIPLLIIPTDKTETDEAMKARFSTIQV